jgi:hypothetical protein
VTEGEWLACTDPDPMVRLLWETGSERNLRLFAVACCKRILHLVPDGLILLVEVGGQAGCAFPHDRYSLMPRLWTIKINMLQRLFANCLRFCIVSARIRPRKLGSGSTGVGRRIRRACRRLISAIADSPSPCRSPYRAVRAL